MSATYAPDRILLEKAETLSEALPYIQRYAGKIFVVKYGGHAMGNPDAAQDFAEDIVLLKAIGIHPVVVHGGGPQIGKMLKALGVESQFIDGLRVTDNETAKIAEMVLSGAINKDIVSWIGRAGGRAVGISGKDAKLVEVEKVKKTRKNSTDGQDENIDLGFVGRPVSVDRRLIDTLTQSGMIPVVAPIGVGADGETYNINADTMAGALAAGLEAARLFLLTDVAGVLDADKKLLRTLTPSQIDSLTKADVISGGMIPKLETCIESVKSGVDAAVILDGRVPHSILIELFTEQGAGTLVKLD
ncbi:MAG: acetylglutamate kinase [Zymomonas mobilis]|uniref:Acetylglutamate kinase n=1 Tax=Zymomonas mobilis subsp. mobilis (strain ATCC 10988 / DSM 424 / LMG 404 / NCIMB 8938 / NRRL B-806 / ZM1) TaxID=555217 RepID=A0A0H3G0A0_ZYMMA|nr:acetylglutamate kinase [Zymomonas mobilis]ACV76241.1 acetylglutamate kinase [Zymomonas mobilis subsp. mobilis NCIMB 11163]AEH63441.1 acetylglutamate kinase [Zymomonas mobilis subsp. mobilis ATCC 10988]AFN57459.1 acetylglutamate kinase [Zymomonas mobilis subsp. mobilis ATCC 29191]ART94039.1 acetylglutamate kinase [Zymomonas mobilis subsp. mobilis]MCP9308030.1 acetylglutamate kinase [Zymomonas mobilis]